MTKLEIKIIELIKEANNEWNLFDEGEKIIIGISGGKDSLALLQLMQQFNVELIPVHVNTHADSESDAIENGITILNRPILKEISKRKNPCFTCSKRKRRALVEYANDLGVSKIAFGHHKDDAIETLLLNQIYSREISTMMPKQTLFDGRFFIIRPLYLIREMYVQNYVDQNSIIPFAKECPYENITKRLYIKELIKKLQLDHPKIDVYDNLFSSMKHIKQDYLPYKIKDKD